MFLPTDSAVSPNYHDNRSQTVDAFAGSR